jgi:uncharacterized protein (TIGR02118 family)
MVPHAVKHLGFVTRKRTLTYDEFIDHWMNVHAPLVAKLPGLLRYSVNLVDRERSPGLDHDGFAELWFASTDALETAFASPEAALLRDDVKHFVDRHMAASVYEYNII